MKNRNLENKDYIYKNFEVYIYPDSRTPIDINVDKSMTIRDAIKLYETLGKILQIKEK